MKPAIFKYILALLLFGTNGIVASFIALSSFEIVLLRTLIGSFSLILIFFLSGGKSNAWKIRRDFAFVMISGIAMGASWILLYEAYTLIGVSLASLVYYCGPVFVLGLSPWIFRERLKLASLIGFAAVLIGLSFVYQGALGQGEISWGILYGILSAVLYAVMVIFNKLASKISGLENAMYQLVVAFLTVALFTLIKQGASIRIESQSIVPLLLLGLVNTGIGCYLYFSSMGQLSAGSVAIVGYLEPLSAVICSAIFLREQLSSLQILGAILILGGAAFGELLRTMENRQVDAPVALKP